MFSSSEPPFTGGFQDGEASAGAGTGTDTGNGGRNQPYSSSHEYHQENSQTQSGDWRIMGQDQQQQRAAQYKLQAKVTGLERTGRKDPILRFDVYVSIFLYLLITYAMLDLATIST